MDHVSELKQVNLLQGGVRYATRKTFDDSLTFAGCVDPPRIGRRLAQVDCSDEQVFPTQLCAEHRAILDQKA